MNLTYCFIRIGNPYEFYRLLIHMKLTDCQSVWHLWIFNPYETYEFLIHMNYTDYQFIFLLWIRTYQSWSYIRKKLTSFVVAPQHLTITMKCKQITTTVHLNQTSHNTEREAQPQEFQIEWCIKKKKKTKKRKKRN